MQLLPLRNLFWFCCGFFHNFPFQFWPFHLVFFSEHRPELASSVQNIPSHSAGSPSPTVCSGQTQQLLLAVPLSQVLLNRSRRYLVGLAASREDPELLQSFSEEVCISSFCVMTGTGPKPVVLGVFSVLKFRAGFVFFSSLRL